MLLAHSRILGENDLAFLEPPAGLSDRNFHAFIGAMLRQVRWIQDLDQLTTQGLTDTVAATTIAASLPPDHDFSPDALWHVTKHWLMPNGRASCRERGCHVGEVWVIARTVQNKINSQDIS